MKILGLKFRNIKTLQGEWEIRFDRPPLSDASLFAIVGPNGAGKTSILDVLTLALYGETARLKIPGSEIMSCETDDSFAEVTFSVNDRLYRSSWSVQKTDGDLKGPLMCLTILDGDRGESMLEDRPARVRERVSELSGLDFKRFCCSILLPQGDFAVFLNALENERADILEGIVGPEMAVELGESIRSRAAVESQRLSQLKEAAQGCKVFDSIRLDEIYRSREKNRAEVQEIDSALNDLRSQVDWIKELERIKAAERGAEQVVSEAEARHMRARADAVALDRAQHIKRFQEPLRDLDGLKGNADSLQSTLDELQKSIPAAKERIDQLEVRLRQVEPELEKAQQQLDERSNTLFDASLRDREIESKGSHYLAAVSRYEDLDRLLKEHLKEQAEIDSRISELQPAAVELREWLDQHQCDTVLQEKLPATQTIIQRLNTARHQISDAQAGKSDLLKVEERTARKLNRSEQAAQKVRGKMDRLQIRCDDSTRCLQELTGNRATETLREDLRTVRTKLSACEKLLKIGQKYQSLVAGEDVDSEIKQIELQHESTSRAMRREMDALAKFAVRLKERDHLLKFGPDRSALKAGQACPLCGALDHPYAVGALPSFVEVERAEQEHQSRIAGFQSELQTLDARASELQKKAGEAERLRLEWAEASTSAGGVWTIADMKLVEDEIYSLQIIRFDLKSRVRRSRWQEWQARWDAYVLERKRKRLSRKEQIRDGIRQEHESQLHELAGWDERMRRGEEDERAALVELTATLVECGETMQIAAGAETDALQRVANRSTAYQSRSKKIDEVSEQLRSLSERKEAIVKGLPKLQEEMEVLSVEVETALSCLVQLKAEREALFGNLDPTGERHALEREIERHRTEQTVLRQEIEALRERMNIEQRAVPRLSGEVQNIRTEIEEKEIALIKQASAADLQTIDELRAMVTVLEDRESILRRMAEAEKALNEAELELSRIRNELTSVRSEHDTDAAMDSIQARIAEKSDHRIALEKTIDEAEGLLREHAEADEKHRDLLQAIAVQAKICDEALAEQEKLQPENAGEAVRRLQRLLLERLVGHTNEHLSLLTGRYSLHLAEGGSLRLHVEDSEQQTTHRTANTLSGGESFVVSLCLALGLSDMAAREHRIESLFLDEGFGTLDEEMLYRVISVLKGLHRYGMQVGVVSHVKRLAEEIPTQIRVMREPTGFGSIKILP